MRPILCVIDLTDSAGYVLGVAAKMAYAYKCSLTILFPYRLIDPGYKGELSNLKIKLEQDANEKFLALKKDITLLDSIPYEFHPEIGFPHDRINAFIRRNKVESVVIGQRQADLLNELNPKTLQNLLANSRRPFVIVPEDTDVEVLTS